MAWSYQREENSFEPIPAGPHRVRIASAEMATSKTSGRQMISMKFDVSGHKGSLFHYIVFMEDNPKMTNRMLTQLFDSFPSIQAGDINPEHWIGTVGACMVKHEEYNGEMKARISSFIPAEKQNGLPQWAEPDKAQSGAPAKQDSGGWITPGNGENVPFF